MCGRYGLGTPEYSETRFSAKPLPDVQPELFVPRFNIAPTQDVLAVATSKRLDGARGLKAMRWGLVAEWALADPKKPRPINVQCETMLDRPYYRRLLTLKRCLIPADGFYEWQRNGSAKQPFNIGLKGGGTFGFAGIWDATKSGLDWLVSCAILTTTPNDLVARLHNRMPVILRPEHEATWLAPDTDLPALLECFAPLPEADMEAYPVVSLVNNVNHEGAELRQAAELAPAQSSLF